MKRPDDVMPPAEINAILLEMAKEIAVARFPYTGGAIRILPDETRVSREDYWNNYLTAEERHHREQEAYAAWMVIGTSRVQAMMVAAAWEYINEK